MLPSHHPKKSPWQQINGNENHLATYCSLTSIGYQDVFWNIIHHLGTFQKCYSYFTITASLSNHIYFLQCEVLKRSYITKHKPSAVPLNNRETIVISISINEMLFTFNFFKSVHFFFTFLFISVLLVCVCLRWAFVAALGLCLVAASRATLQLQCADLLRCPLLLQSMGSGVHGVQQVWLVVSVVAAQVLFGAQSQLPHGMWGLPEPGVKPTGTWILYL